MRTATIILLALVALLHSVQASHMRGSLMALNDNTARNHAKVQWDVAQNFQQYLNQAKIVCKDDLLPVQCQIITILRKIEESRGNADQILGLKHALLKFEIDEHSELAAERRDVLVAAKTGRIDMSKVSALQVEISTSLALMQQRLIAIKNKQVQDLEISSQKAVLAEQLIKRMQTNLDRFLESHAAYVKSRDADIAQFDKLKERFGKSTSQVGSASSQAVRKVSAKAKDTYSDSAIHDKVLDKYLQASIPLK
jgi:hypothetical protein